MPQRHTVILTHIWHLIWHHYHPISPKFTPPPPNASPEQCLSGPASRSDEMLTPCPSSRCGRQQVLFLWCLVLWCRDAPGSLLELPLFLSWPWINNEATVSVSHLQGTISIAKIITLESETITVQLALKCHTDIPCMTSCIQRRNVQRHLHYIDSRHQYFFLYTS